MFGHEASEGARYTLNYYKKKEKFSCQNKVNLLELGAGLGRDTKYFVTESNLINITNTAPYVIVVKKNSKTLKHLNSWLNKLRRNFDDKKINSQVLLILGPVR